MYCTGNSVKGIYRTEGRNAALSSPEVPLDGWSQGGTWVGGENAVSDSTPQPFLLRPECSFLFSLVPLSVTDVSTLS